MAPSSTTPRGRRAPARRVSPDHARELRVVDIDRVGDVLVAVPAVGTGDVLARAHAAFQGIAREEASARIEFPGEDGRRFRHAARVAGASERGAGRGVVRQAWSTSRERVRVVDREAIEICHTQLSTPGLVDTPRLPVRWCTSAEGRHGFAAAFFEHAPSITVTHPARDRASSSTGRPRSRAAPFPTRTACPWRSGAAATAKVEEVDGNVYIRLLRWRRRHGRRPRRPRGRAAAEAQLDNLTHALDLPAPPRRDPGRRRFTPLLPKGLTRLSFGGPTGLDAFQSALKLAKLNTDRVPVIAFEGSYHGMTAGALSVTSRRAYKDRLLPLVPEVHFVPYAAPATAGLREDRRALRPGVRRLLGARPRGPALGPRHPRGGHRRADPGRGRLHRAARRVHPARPRGVHAARRRNDRRRGAIGLLPDRKDVRAGAHGHRARHHDDEQGARRHRAADLRHRVPESVSIPGRGAPTSARSAATSSRMRRVPRPCGS